ncbi:helix-turn-helix domain-containing protein [Yunchengibacter salinarum]|uniref:helix-turn-helix domain-containing protein n=1 Tax=Yunchengibacter salinarum TaxID=3133399 RepID=UPI0035B5DCD1
MDDASVSIADRLKTARRDQQREIGQIASEICVRSTYLEAMEAGDFDALPEQAFAVGFVRAYADALGLDGAEIVRAFKEESGLRERPVFEYPEVTRVRRVPVWLAPVGGLAGVAAIWALVGSGIFNPTLEPGADFELSAEAQADRQELSEVQQALAEQQGRDAAPSDEASRTVKTAAADGDEPLRMAAAQAPESKDFEGRAADRGAAPEAGGPAPDSPRAGERNSGVDTVVAAHSLFPAAEAADGQTASPATAGRGLTLTAHADTWVRLARGDGSEVWSGLLMAGEQYRPRVEPDMTLSASNAAGLSLTLDGTRLGVIGERGQLVRHMALDRRSLMVARPMSGGDMGGR